MLSVSINEVQAVKITMNYPAQTRRNSGRDTPENNVYQAASVFREKLRSPVETPHLNPGPGEGQPISDVHSACLVENAGALTSTGRLPICHRKLKCTL